METVVVDCGSCGRRVRVHLTVLTRIPSCTYCGRRLRLPGEIESKLRERLGRGTLDVSCPSCARVQEEKRPDGSAMTRCRVCGCPFLVPLESGVGTDAPCPEMPMAALPCPRCENSMELPGEWTARTVACAACDQVIDLQSLVYFSDFGGCPRFDPLVEVVQTATGEAGQELDRIRRSISERLVKCVLCFPACRSLFGLRETPRRMEPLYLSRSKHWVRLILAGVR